MITTAGGLEGNDGVVELVEKGNLHHDAAHDQHHLTQPPLLCHGHFLYIQQHCVWDITSDTQPGVCVCVFVCLCQLWLQDQDFQFYYTPIQYTSFADCKVCCWLSDADGADDDKTWWDGNHGRDGSVGGWSAAESDFTLGQSIGCSPAPFLWFSWWSAGQHGDTTHQHTGVIYF